MTNKMRNKLKIGIGGASLTPALAILLALMCSSAGAAGDADQLNFSTGQCTLKEPVYGQHTFDFNALHSELAHVVSGMSSDIFEFNICGNLTRSCNNESNVAACLKRQGKEYVLGRQHELQYHNGKIFLDYLNGSKCENGTAGAADYELHVKLSCDYTLDASQLHVTGYAENACHFYINYDTPLACLPVPAAQQSNSCSVRDSQTGATFDLLPLSEGNYRTSDRQGSIFVINVCKPVLYGENAMCPEGSSICLYAPKATELSKRFVNYGTVQPQPLIENGSLLLRHESATRCSQNANRNYTSVVNFYCDKEVKNAHPEFVGLEDCTYQFSFSTPLACNDLKPCTAVTQGNELLDLSALSVEPPRILTKDNKNYTFAVCRNAGSPCLENNGACYSLNAQTTSLGVVNSHLRFNQTGAPYLLYEGGANCQKEGGNTPWSTKIEFVCANNATKDNGNAVKIIEDSNCQLLIQYQTPYACQQQITCKAKLYVEHGADGSVSGGDELVDLTPLISADNNYEAAVELPPDVAQQVPKTTKFFLNVCRPLVPKYQLGCAGGSGACMAKVTAAGAPEEEHSLGFPHAALVAINRTAAQLLYLNGDPCPSDKGTNLSTRIEFNCNMRAGRGRPVLRSISDCQYRFDWATSVICPPHECSFSAESCDIVQDELHMKYNFKQAPFTSDGKLSIDYNNSKLMIDICGLHRKAITDYSQDLVNIFFTHAAPGCGKEGNMNVQMRLICSNQTQSVSTISDGAQCNLLYVQRTPSICEFLGLRVPSQDGSSSTQAPPTSKPAAATTSTTATPPTAAPFAAEQAGSVGTILAAILSVTLCVACLGLFAFSPARRQRVVRLFRRSSSAVRYSRVQSNEEANLLLEPNGEFTESDDDMLL